MPSEVRATTAASRATASATARSWTRRWPPGAREDQAAAARAAVKAKAKAACTSAVLTMPALTIRQGRMMALALMPPARFGGLSRWPSSAQAPRLRPLLCPRPRCRTAALGTAPQAAALGTALQAATLRPRLCASLQLAGRQAQSCTTASRCWARGSSRTRCLRRLHPFRCTPVAAAGARIVVAACL